jgi:AcrR family transcriptional regulator
VLRAALSAFEELGADKVRVQDIAERAGMSPGHVLYYFTDRDHILMSTLMLSEENLAARRDRAVEKATDFDDAVERFTRLYLPTGPRDVRWALWAQMIARPPTDAGERKRLLDTADGWTSCLAALIAEHRGTHSSTQDCLVAADRYCRLMDGLAMEVLLAGPGRGRSWALREATDAFPVITRW